MEIIPASMPPFPRWLELNQGLVTLLAEASSGGPLPAGMRLAAQPSGALAVLARACAVGPECMFATIYDGPGGFRLAFAGPGPAAAMPPIAAEAAVVAALRAIGARLAERGFPAPLTAFAPGGALHAEGFHPLLPTSLCLDGGTVKAAHEAALAAIEGGAVRIAPSAVVPDAWHKGAPVYDLRVPEEVLPGLFAMVGLDPEAARSVLIRRESIGGGAHYLIADGVRTPEGCVTLMRAAEPGAAARDFWPKSEYPCEDVPPFLADRSPSARKSLN